MNSKRISTSKNQINAKLSIGLIFILFIDNKKFKAKPHIVGKQLYKIVFSKGHFFVVACKLYPIWIKNLKPNPENTLQYS